jgi:hypothetical protein
MHELFLTLSPQRGAMQRIVLLITNKRKIKKIKIYHYYEVLRKKMNKSICHSASLPFPELWSCGVANGFIKPCKADSNTEL